MNSCGANRLQKCPFEKVAILCEELIHIQAPSYLESSKFQAVRILEEFKVDLKIVQQKENDIRRLVTSASKPDAQIWPTSANQNPKEALKWVSEISAATNRLVRVWFSNRRKLPIIDKLSATLPTRRPIRGDLAKMSTKIEASSVRILDTVALAVAAKYRILVGLLLPKPSQDPTIRQEAAALWDHFSKVCLKIQPPPAYGWTFNSLRNSNSTATLEYKREKFVLRQYFNYLLHEKLVKQLETTKPIINIPAARSLILKPKSSTTTSELSVAKDQECNPCAQLIDDAFRSP